MISGGISIKAIKLTLVVLTLGMLAIMGAAEDWSHDGGHGDWLNPWGGAYYYTSYPWYYTTYSYPSYYYNTYWYNNYWYDPYPTYYSDYYWTYTYPTHYYNTWYYPTYTHYWYW